MATKKPAQKKKEIVLTGDRPTGRLHLGHYVGSIKNRIELQDKYKQYVMVADIQALTDNYDDPAKVRKNTLEITLDNIAAGVDPKKTTFFIQSQIPEIAELTVLFLNLVTLARLRRNPTVKDEMNQKGYGEEVPAGFLVYPVSQAADILSVRASIIPVGGDQLPMIEQTNEIVDKFNRIYGKTFPHVKALVSEAPRMKGIDGKAKMSKSLDNCIYLADSPKELAEKVMKMYTDPGHIHVSDPGKVEGNVVFEYLDAFDTDKKGVAELKAQYQKGGLGDVVLKKRLIEVLEKELAPIRKRRAELAKDPKKIIKILEKGTKEVRAEAKKTLDAVKKAVKIDHF